MNNKVTTKTQTFEEWLTQCPDKFQFMNRFIDVKLDVESVAEFENVTLTDEQLNNVIDRFTDSDWSHNNEVISELIEDELREAE